MSLCFSFFFFLFAGGLATLFAITWIQQGYRGSRYVGGNSPEGATLRGLAAVPFFFLVATP